MGLDHPISILLQSMRILILLIIMKQFKCDILFTQFQFPTHIEMLLANKNLIVKRVYT